MFLAFFGGRLLSAKSPVWLGLVLIHQLSGHARVNSSDDRIPDGFRRWVNGAGQPSGADQAQKPL